ncbi:hypothetical protein QL285_039866 [Trifolium repens]|nr:hypothetical protein QL285_039866 [Trifolium repens]
MASHPSSPVDFMVYSRFIRNRRKGCEAVRSGDRRQQLPSPPLMLVSPTPWGICCRLSSSAIALSWRQFASSPSTSNDLGKIIRCGQI